MPPKTSLQHHSRDAGFDTMTSPVSANPASLLWAEQLRRENTHLLARMGDLEAQQRVCDVVVKPDRMIKDLSSRIDAICDDEKNQKDMLDRIVGENHARTEKASELWRMTQQKVSTLDTQYRTMQGDMKQSVSNLDEAARSIEAIQTTLRQLQGTINSKLAFPSDNSALLRRLDTLESSRSEEAKEVRRMQNKVIILEQTCQAVTVGNNELQSEITRLEAVISTKTLVLPATKGSARSSTREQPPTSPVSNERINLNSPAASSTVNPHKRRLSALLYSFRQTGQEPPDSSRTQLISNQPSGLDIPSPFSAAQRRKEVVTALNNTHGITVNRPQVSGGARTSRDPIKHSETSETQGTISSEMAHSRVADIESGDSTGTPSSRMTRSQAKKDQSMQTTYKPLIRSPGHYTQISISVGQPSLATTNDRVKNARDAASVEKSTKHTSSSRTKKPQGVESLAMPSVYNTRSQAKKAGRKTTISAQPFRVSDMRPPQADSRDLASDKPRRDSTLRLPPQDIQGSLVPSRTRAHPRKACGDCRRRRIGCKHRENDQIEHHSPVSTRLGKRPDDVSLRSIPSSEPMKKKPRVEIQQLEDLNAFFNSGL